MNKLYWGCLKRKTHTYCTFHVSIHALKTDSRVGKICSDTHESLTAAASHSKVCVCGHLSEIAPPVIPTYDVCEILCFDSISLAITLPASFIHTQTKYSQSERYLNS